MTDTRFTHKGWFLLCPVYIGAPYSFGPMLTARRRIPEWWFTVNEWLMGACVFALSYLNPEWEPVFPIRITGKIENHSHSDR